MRRAVPLVLVLAVAATVPAGCSDDDEPAASATAPGEIAATTVAPPAGAAGPTTPPTTVPPPASLEDLAAGLLATADVGVPAGWAIRDLDPAIMDAEMAALADPLQGLVACPDGALRPPAGWLQRTYSGAEPLDDGRLRVDLVLAVEDAGSFDGRRVALAACTAAGESSLEWSTATVAADTEAVTMALSAGPSADVPYPSSYALVAANRDGHTVTAVVGGIDLGVPFADTTRDLVGRVLARL